MGLLSKIFGQTEKTPKIYYSINYKAYNVKVNISCGSSVIINDEFEFSGTGARPINDFLKDSSNQITIRLDAVDKNKEDWSFDLLITKAMEGQYADEGEELWHFHADYQDTTKSLPLEVSNNIVK